MSSFLKTFQEPIELNDVAWEDQTASVLAQDVRFQFLDLDRKGFKSFHTSVRIVENGVELTVHGQRELCVLDVGLWVGIRGETTQLSLERERDF